MKELKVDSSSTDDPTAGGIREDDAVPSPQLYYFTSSVRAAIRPKDRGVAV